MLYFFRVGLLTGVLFMALACQTRTPEARSTPNDPSNAPESVDGIPKGATTVCIWDRAVLRSEPSYEKGKWLASIALGEKVTWLGDTQTDSSSGKKLEFHKVRLSDGKEGWALAYVLVRDAVPAAVIQKTYIYQRPDILTVTDQAFEPMDLLAVSKIEGDWLEVIGNQRKKSGWIKKDGVSFREEDVAVAALAYKAFREEDEAVKRQKLLAIIENPALSNSIFMAGLRATLNPVPSPQEMMSPIEELPPGDTSQDYRQ